MSAPHINQLREHLLATLADLRNRENPMEPDRARAVAQVASVLVDTAKVEVDYLKATNQDRSGFMEEPPTPGFEGVGSNHTKQSLPAPGNGVLSITRHTLKG